MRIIPSAYNGNGEKKTRDLINQLESKSFELAFWSIHVHQHEKKEFSDIDFLLLTERGICCIEVKGGRVEYSNGKTTYTDKHGSRTTKNESPNAQAASNKRALKRGIENQFPEYKNAFSYAHAVVLPDQNWDFSKNNFEMNKEVIFDKTSFQKGPEEFKKFLNKLFTYFSKDLIYKDAKPLDSIIIKKLKEFLRPNYDLLTSLKDSNEEMKQTLLKMTPEQLNLVNTFDENDRVMVNGPAGSGKTLMAKKIAEDLVELNINVCYLVRNKHWYRYIRHSFEEKGCDVLCLEEDFKSTKKYLAVIVDEGQDLANLECLEKFESLFQVPMDQSKIYWFMDRLHQSNLYHDVDLNTLDIINDNFSKFNLQENCRNPKRIIEETNKITGTSIKNNVLGESPIPNYTFIDSDSPEMHAAELQNILDNLVQERIPIEDICIISKCNQNKSCLHYLASDTKKLIGEFRSPIKNYPFIRFYDVLSFKGQEAPFVILVDWYSDQSDKNILNIFYSVLTRSTHSVYVVTSHKEQYLKTMVSHA
jgi:cytidylate kinase